tara:strand:- start:225 stop:557 length:333 start_codon:yes stop_codon:yes gene_type:complete
MMPKRASFSSVLIHDFKPNSFTTMKFKNASGATYDLEQHPKGGWICTRTTTGSTCKISKALVEKTKARLARGEQIPFRGISYTVAIETAVLFLLRDSIHIDNFSRTYSAR